MTRIDREEIAYQIKVPVDRVVLEGEISLPLGTRGIVVFVHGSASSRHSPKNRYLAQALRQAGLGTFLLDLLTLEEEKEDLETGRYRFNIRLLANRLSSVVSWLKSSGDTARLAAGYFGTGTGTAAALTVAAEHPEHVAAIVSRSGRPDMVKAALPYVKAPVLLIVGGKDLPVVAMNRDAVNELKGEKKLVIVPGATHLFEGPTALEEVARLAVGWFTTYLNRPGSSSSSGSSE